MGENRDITDLKVHIQAIEGIVIAFAALQSSILSLVTDVNPAEAVRASIKITTSGANEAEKERLTMLSEAHIDRILDEIRRVATSLHKGG